MLLGRPYQVLKPLPVLSPALPSDSTPTGSWPDGVRPFKARTLSRSTLRKGREEEREECTVKTMANSRKQYSILKIVNNCKVLRDVKGWTDWIGVTTLTVPLHTTMCSRNTHVFDS